MSAHVSVHDTKSVAVTGAKFHEMPEGGSFWSRTLYVYDERGQAMQLTLFADSREQLLFEEDTR